jgi:hypothetical protein
MTAGTTLTTKYKQLKDIFDLLYLYKYDRVIVIDLNRNRLSNIRDRDILRIEIDDCASSRVAFNDKVSERQEAEYENRKKRLERYVQDVYYGRFLTALLCGAALSLIFGASALLCKFSQTSETYVAPFLWVLFGVTFGCTVLETVSFRVRPELKQIPDVIQKVFDPIWIIYAIPIVIALGLALMFANEILSVSVVGKPLTAFWNGNSDEVKISTGITLGLFTALAGSRAVRLLKEVFGHHSQ